MTNIQVWYHVGSKDEKPGRTGFAHLFEHLMFKGSAHIKPEEHDKIITNAGGVSNAYTQDDVTVYWETFPANYLEKVLWMEADRLATLDVSPANFKSCGTAAITEPGKILQFLPIRAPGKIVTLLPIHVLSPITTSS